MLDFRSSWNVSEDFLTQQCSIFELVELFPKTVLFDSTRFAAISRISEDFLDSARLSELVGFSEMVLFDAARFVAEVGLFSKLFDKLFFPEVTEDD